MSVVTPCYNMAAFIREAIESALNQTYPIYEIIVVDDGSTDNSLDVLGHVKDPRLKVLRANHGGISRARNYALEHVGGDILSLLDADDRWLPQKVENEVAVFRTEPSVGSVFVNFQRFGQEGLFSHPQFDFYPELSRLPSRPAKGGQGHVIVGDSFAQLIAFNQIPGWAPATSFRWSVVKDLRYHEELPPAEDMHFCFRAYRRAEVAYIDEPLVQVRRHGSNATRDVSKQTEFIERSLMALEAEDLTPRQRRALNERLSRQHIACGVLAARDGDLGRAFRAYGRALRRGGRKASLAKQLLLTPAHFARSFAPQARPIAPHAPGPP